MHVDRDKQAEIDANLEVFIASFAALAGKFPGQHVLIRKGEVIAAFVTPLQAQREGERLFDDGLFSVQEVTAQVADLGFYSHAMHLWPS